jgi:hypothetical protein
VDPNCVSYVEPDCYRYSTTFGYRVAYANANLHCAASPAADCHSSDPDDNCGAQMSFRCCVRACLSQGW